MSGSKKAAKRKPPDPRPPEIEEPEAAGPGTGGDGLILPVASVERLEETFRMYQEVKQKILDEGDYTWFAIWMLGEKEKRKGFKRKDEAEAHLLEFKNRNVPCRVEKKIAKSGCLKLGVAFGVDTEVIDQDLRPPDYAHYKLRATLPNGKGQTRGGSCHRSERGMADRPYDQIEAIALTRAINRAILGVLGGENSAEEFEEVPPEDGSAAPRQETPSAPAAKPLTPEEVRRQVDELHGVTQAAPPVDRNTLIKRIWSIACAGRSKETAEKKLRATIKSKYDKDSMRDLTDQELAQLDAAMQKGSKSKQEPATAAPAGGKK